VMPRAGVLHQQTRSMHLTKEHRRGSQVRSCFKVLTMHWINRFRFHVF